MAPATSCRTFSRGAEAARLSADKYICLWVPVVPETLSFPAGGTWSSLPFQKVAQRPGSKPVALDGSWDREGFLQVSRGKSLKEPPGSH